MSLNRKNEYIESLIKEIKHFYKGNLLKTLYFGGGTPSVLEADDVKKILDCFNFDSDTEITFEMNPKDVNPVFIKKLKEMKINRLSLGVQSFDNEMLFEIGREHKKEDILLALNIIQKEGFDNFSIDLIYGLVNQTVTHFLNTLDEAIALNIPHISLYGLKIEEGTYYFKNPPKNLPDSDMQAKIYEAAINKLDKNYLHYEFSNFSKSEKNYSKHNLCYWNRENYFGFGLSASGFIENKRYTNTFNFSEYLKNPIEKKYEELTRKMQIEEEIFLGLRRNKGINFDEINKKYNIDIYEKFKKNFDKFLNEGFLKKTDFGVKFSKKGILVSNEILCEFIDI